MKRDVVGIDLGDEYVSDINAKLVNSGSSTREWSSLVDSFGSEPSGWKDWPGTKANFRKPNGGKRKKS